MFGLVNGPHPALTEQSHNFEVADALPEHLSTRPPLRSTRPRRPARHGVPFDHRDVVTAYCIGHPRATSVGADHAAASARMRRITLRARSPRAWALATCSKGRDDAR